MTLHRGPKGHINIRIQHSGSKAIYRGDTGNHGLQDPCVCVVLTSAAVAETKLAAPRASACGPAGHQEVVQSSRGSPPNNIRGFPKNRGPFFVALIIRALLF